MINLLAGPIAGMIKDAVTGFVETKKAVTASFIIPGMFLLLFKKFFVFVLPSFYDVFVILCWPIFI